MEGHRTSDRLAGIHEQTRMIREQLDCWQIGKPAPGREVFPVYLFRRQKLI